MKKWSAIIAIAATIVLVALLIHDFITSDPIHYFGEQPRRFILVAAIALGGGLLTFAFYRLPPQWRDRVHLFGLGIGATFLTALTGYAVYYLLRWSSLSGSSDVLFALLVLIFSGSIAGMLWLRFYRRFRNRAL